MKHIYTFLLFLFTINLVTSQTTVGFEIGDNWSPSPSGYGDYIYTEGNFTASGISILKETSERKMVIQKLLIIVLSDLEITLHLL